MEYDEWYRKVLEIIPDADIQQDVNGVLVIDTNLTVQFVRGEGGEEVVTVQPVDTQFSIVRRLS
jgi:hypothetical protein